MYRHSLTWKSVALISAALALAACSSESLPFAVEGGLEDAADGAEGSAMEDVEASSQAADVESGEAAAADADAAMPLSDEQIVYIVHVSNQCEIQTAQLALMHAVNQQVRDFANTMITDHTAGETALTMLFASPDAGPDADASALDAALTREGGVPSAPSYISNMLQQECMLQQQTLMLKTGSAFDLTYMSGQVSAHSEVLQLIDNVLIPAAASPALKTALMQAATVLSQHLQMAINILNAIAAAPPTD
jgi:putative membrane protein